MGVVRGPAPYYYSGVRSNIPGNPGARHRPTPVVEWWGGGCVVFSTHVHLTVVSLVSNLSSSRGILETKLNVLRRWRAARGKKAAEERLAGGAGEEWGVEGRTHTRWVVGYRAPRGAVEVL